MGKTLDKFNKEFSFNGDYEFVPWIEGQKNLGYRLQTTECPETADFAYMLYYVSLGGKVREGQNLREWMCILMEDAQEHKEELKNGIEKLCDIMSQKNA